MANVTQTGVDLDRFRALRKKYEHGRSFGRQEGRSLYAAYDAVRQAVEFPGCTVLWFIPVMRMTDYFRRYIARAAEDFGIKIKRYIGMRALFILENDSRIQFYTPRSIEQGDAMGQYVFIAEDLGETAEFLDMQSESGRKYP